MKAAYTTAFFLVVVLNIFVLANEFLTAQEFRNALSGPTKGLPAGSVTFRKAYDDPRFVASEAKAVRMRISRLRSEIVRCASTVLITLLFLNGYARKCTKKLTQRQLGVIGPRTPNTNMCELNYMCVLLTPIMFLTLGNMVTRALLGRMDSPVVQFIFYVAIFAVVMPVLMLIAFKLFSVYGARIILACYIAYFVKAFSELLTQEKVDMALMERMSIDQFSETVRSFLKERGLEKRVYKERKESKIVNAALVGWGSNERIEIYGDHNHFNNKEFESILLHELGHSEHRSLFKKISMLFVLKIIEMAFLLLLYMRIADKYSDETISTPGAFIILYVLYLLFVSQWLFMFHRLTSQMAEVSADMIAKRLRYGEELSDVLYKISVKSEDYLFSTELYNALRSYHPTIFDRIEYLNK